MTGLRQSLPIPLPASFGGTGLSALGTGTATALGTNVGSAGGVVVNGGALGTPSSGNLSSTNAVTILGQSGIPLIVAGSGSIADNGALTLTTALTTTYTSAYVYLPAAAIVAGGAAGWYYAVFSSTTAATLYNNTYTSGTPAIPGSPTAFSTTGPGGYTGKSTVQAAYSLTIAGNTIGINGGVRLNYAAVYTNSASTKTIQAAYGAFTFGSYSATTTTTSSNVLGFKNRGQAGAQVGLTFSTGNPYTVAAVVLLYGTVDTTSSQTLSLNLTNATPASNNLLLEHITVELLPSVA